MRGNAIVILLAGSALGYGIVQTVLYFSNKPAPEHRSPSPEKQAPFKIGDIVDTHNGIPIYFNGIKYAESHGKHESKDGYYYGHKWQCVEFVKRYYYEAFQHKMPNVWGHAKDYFDPQIEHGQTNSERGMLQFHNGENEKPRPHDLLVWNSGKYGHVAVITEVDEDSVTVVQQNVLNRPKQTFTLAENNGNWLIAAENNPAGWLRLPQQH